MLRWIVEKIRRRVAKKVGLKTTFIAGHAFSWWENPTQAPQKRVVAYFHAQHAAKLGVGEVDYRKYIEVLREAINSSNLVKAAEVLAAMEQQVDLFATWRNTFRMGNALILVDGEPIEEPTEKYTELKYKLCAESEEVRAFFFSAVWDTLTLLRASAKRTESSDYINREEIKEAEKLISSLIGSPTYKEI